MINMINTINISSVFKHFSHKYCKTREMLIELLGPNPFSAFLGGVPHKSPR